MNFKRLTRGPFLYILLGLIALLLLTDSFRGDGDYTEVPTERVLAAEFEPTEASVPELVPERRLGVGRVGAKLSPLEQGDAHGRLFGRRGRALRGSGTIVAPSPASKTRRPLPAGEWFSGQLRLAQLHL